MATITIYENAFTERLLRIVPWDAWRSLVFYNKTVVLNLFYVVIPKLDITFFVTPTRPRVNSLSQNVVRFNVSREFIWVVVMCSVYFHFNTYMAISNKIIIIFKIFYHFEWRWTFLVVIKYYTHLQIIQFWFPRSMELVVVNSQLCRTILVSDPLRQPHSSQVFFLRLKKTHFKVQN